MALLQPNTVALDSIRPEFSWSLHQDLKGVLSKELADSIRRIGILHPPVLLKQKDNTYETICGAGRIMAAREILKTKNVACLLPDSTVDTDDLLQLVIEDQKLTGFLSPIEKARFALLCRKYKASNAVILTGAGIGSEGEIDRLIRLLDLEQPLRQSLHTGDISEKIALELLSLPVADRIALHELFSFLSINNNKQKRIIELGRIIAARENCSLAELFSNQYASYLEKSNTGNVPQAVKQLLNDMDQRANPMIRHTEKLFAERVANLRLPDNCSISPSPSFEQDKVTVRIDFSSLDAFASIWQRLKACLR